MKAIEALKAKIKELIPGKDGVLKLNAKVETTISVYNHFYKSDRPEVFLITKAERAGGYYHVSDGFNDFMVNELSDEGANKILEQLKNQEDEN